MVPAMIRRLFAIAAFAFMAAGAADEARAQPQQNANPPVLVELYSSQGCLACPRANRLLGQFSRETDVIALTFPVGYWDYLGWSDTFAQPEFTSRQRNYARSLRFRGPYTPQLIIDGIRQVSAADWDESRAALEAVQLMPRVSYAPEISLRKIDNGRVRLDISGRPAANGAAADIWLIAYDPGPLTVYITGGENAHRNVVHFNVVRRVFHVGSWNGEQMSIERQRCRPECVAIIQGPRGGRVLAVAATHHRGAND